MKKAVKATISPCLAKGRYGGKQGGAGRAYKINNETIVASGCECSQSWVMFGAKPCELKRSDFFLNPSNLSLTKKSVQQGKEEIPVVPCKETFLLPTSSGTKAYKKATESKFRGCYPLEERLLENKEVRHEPFDNLSADVEVNPTDDPLGFPTTDKFLTSKSDMEGYLLEASEEYHKQNEALGVATSQPSLSLWDVGQTLQEERNQLENHSSLLTPKQREAVRLVYLENEKRLSVPEVAKKLKVSTNSLKDRLNNALKRIRQQEPGFKFPERRKSSERAKYWEPQDSQLDGLYRKSNSKAQLIKVLDPASLEVVKVVNPKDFKKLGWGKNERPNADKEAVKQWALEKTQPPKYSN